LCLEAEAKLPGIVCLAMRVEMGGVLRPIGAPSLSPEFLAALDGLTTGPDVASSAAAAYLRHPIICADVEGDPRWPMIADIACLQNIKACWSYPVIGTEGNAIGVLTLYARDARGPSDEEAACINTWRDLCEIALRRFELSDHRARSAQVDALTGLPNRAAFDTALAGLRTAPPGSWAMFVIDLDNLKRVNDVFGHKAGDDLIRIAGARIAEAMEPDVTFRLGGDEFVVVVRRREWLEDLNAAAGNILIAMDAPAMCDGHSVIPTGSIGGAVFDGGHDDAQAVYQNADFALYHAKETGRGGFVRYWPGIGSRISDRRTAVRDVSQALDDGRIEAYYQPVVQLDTRKIVGVEALCRMRTPSGEIVAASEFKDATADAKVAIRLTSRMLEIIAEDVAVWRARQIPLPQIELNVSMADFYADDVLAKLEAAFAPISLPLSMVTLDISEDVATGQSDRVVAREIERLRRKGVRVALDEFGKGRASLTNLLDVPVDEIKIARSFVERLWPGDPAMVVVQGLIDIARQLNIRVVAQGIETEVQASQLWTMGCRHGQGFAFTQIGHREAMAELLRVFGQETPGSIPLLVPPPAVSAPRPEARKRA